MTVITPLRQTFREAPVRGRSQVVRRPGFTLIEVTVVVILIVIFATMLVPRMVGQQAREFQKACDEVADLLTMYAKRESISSSQIGLRYDENQRRLEVIVYDEEHRPGYPVRSVWREDRHIRPVRLPDFAELIEFNANGELHNLAQWPFVSQPGQQRPTITLVLRGIDESRTFVLPSYAIAPRSFRESETVTGIYEQVDLNAIGRRRDDW